MPEDTDTTLTEDEIIDKDATLPTPDELEPVKTEEEDEEREEEEEESDEEKSDDEDEDKEEETEEDKDEPKEIAKGLSAKELNKEFPGIFKKFPQLRTELYSGIQIKEVIPTVEDAKELVQRNDFFTNFENEILGGNSKLFIGSVLENEGGDKFFENLLPTLFEENKEVFRKTVEPTLINILKEVKSSGENTKDQNVVNAVKIISKVLFHSLELPEIKKSKVDPERNKLEEERRNDFRERAQEFKSEAISDMEEKIREEIARILDPENAFPNLVQEALHEKIYKELGAILSQDKAHLSRMNNYWAKAPIGNYQELKRYKSSMVTAFLARAKSEIPALKKKYISEYLKSSKNTVRKETRHIPEGSTPTKSRNRTISIKEAKEKGLTEDQILGIDNGA